MGATAPAMASHRAAAVALPLLTVMVGLVASLVGISAMKPLEKRSPSGALHATTWIAGVLFLAADATASRTARNHRLALDRLARAGVEILSTEMAVFEWLRHSDRAEFPELLALVK